MQSAAFVSASLPMLFQVFLSRLLAFAQHQIDRPRAAMMCLRRVKRHHRLQLRQPVVEIGFKLVCMIIRPPGSALLNQYAANIQLGALTHKTCHLIPRLRQTAMLQVETGIGAITPQTQVAKYPFLYTITLPADGVGRVQPFQRRQRQSLGGAFRQLAANALVGIHTQRSYNTVILPRIGIMMATDSFGEHLLHEVIVIIRSHKGPSSPGWTPQPPSASISSAASSKFHA